MDQPRQVHVRAEQVEVWCWAQRVWVCQRHAWAQRQAGAAARAQIFPHGKSARRAQGQQERAVQTCWLRLSGMDSACAHPGWGSVMGVEGMKVLGVRVDEVRWVCACACAQS